MWFNLKTKKHKENHCPKSREWLPLRGERNVTGRASRGRLGDWKWPTSWSGGEDTGVHFINVHYTVYECLVFFPTRCTEFAAFKMERKCHTYSVQNIMGETRQDNN